MKNIAARTSLYYATYYATRSVGRERWHLRV